MPTVLAILAEVFEEIEAVHIPSNLLRRAGADVTVAALATVCTSPVAVGITLHADTSLARPSKPASLSHEFRLDFSPRRPGLKILRADPRVVALVRRQHDAGRWLAAICAAPTVLHGAGLLAGPTPRRIFRWLES